MSEEKVGEQSLEDHLRVLIRFNGRENFLKTVDKALWGDREPFLSGRPHGHFYCLNYLNCMGSDTAILCHSCGGAICPHCGGRTLWIRDDDSVDIMKAARLHFDQPGLRDKDLLKQCQQSVSKRKRDEIND